MHETKSFAEISLDLLKAIIALTLVLGIFKLLGLNSNQPEGSGLFALGFLILAGTVGGRLAALIGLPRLTGYLIAGLLVSPSGFEIINASQVKGLTLINNLALALIAFQAGCEFTNDMLRKNLKSLVYGTISHVFVMAIGISLVVYLVSYFFGLTHGYEGTQLIAFALILGTLAVAKSPAAVVAVLGETQSKGPLSDHALGIVVLLDVVVLALFSVVLVISGSLFDPSAEMNFSQLYTLSQEILVSIAAGCTFGLWTILYFKFIGKARILFVVASAYGVSAFCSYLNYDTMLVFVVAGYIVTNMSKQGFSLVHDIESISSIVMIVFFATAGASLHIDQLKSAWELVLIIFFARIALTWLSSYVGHVFAKDKGVVRSLGFTPFISQAGLAIGLVILISQRFPGIGDKIAVIGISVIALNEMAGPVIFKYALQRAGEVGKKLSEETSPSEEPVTTSSVTSS